MKNDRKASADGRSVKGGQSQPSRAQLIYDSLLPFYYLLACIVDVSQARASINLSEFVFTTIFTSLARSLLILTSSEARRLPGTESNNDRHYML